MEKNKTNAVMTKAYSRSETSELIMLRDKIIACAAKFIDAHDYNMTTSVSGADGEAKILTINIYRKNAQTIEPRVQETASNKVRSNTSRNRRDNKVAV